MSLQRLKRLQRLEQRQVRGPAYVNPGRTAIELLQWHTANWEAVSAGHACQIPVYGPFLPLNDEATAALALRMRETDTMHARLTAERAKAA
jgi:hypothetical protein